MVQYDMFNVLGIEVGSKALGCFGGCDFHGLDRGIAWTQLDQTAMPGETVIRVTDSVENWEIGDEIVIATTGFRYISGIKVRLLNWNFTTRIWGCFEKVLGLQIALPN